MFNVGDFIFTTTAYANLLTEPLYGFVVEKELQQIWVVWVNPPPSIVFHDLGVGQSISYSMSTAIKYFERA